MAHAGLTALIGTRFYPEVIPEGATYPAVRYLRVDSPEVGQTHDSGPAGLARPRFQFDVYAETATLARDTAEQLRLAFEGQQDKAANPRVDAVLAADRRSGREPDTNLYRQILEFFIWHAEAVS